MMELCGHATRDGARLLDEVEGAGEAEVWMNLVLDMGGVCVCSPWVLFMAYPKEGEPRTLYVPYLYGRLREIAAVSRLCLDSGDYDLVEFRKNFLKGDAAEGPWVYDARRIVERMERMARLQERRKAV